MAEHNTAMLLKELEVSKMIHRQIAKLNSASDLKKAVNEVLACVGEYLGAERAYIFEESDNYYSNTFEWCAEGITAEIDTLQNITADSIFYWVETLEKGKCVVVGDIEDIKETSPFVYETLSRQNIKSAVEAPITIGSKLIGFIGVDNAPKDVTAIVEESLMILGTFIGTVIQNKEEHEKIRKSHADMKDSRDMQREMLNSINCGVFAYTIPEYKILMINDEAKKIISCKKGDDPVNAITDFIKLRVYPDDRERVWSDGEQQLKKSGDSIRHSYRVLLDGEIINIQSKVRMLQFANGQKYILCSMLNVTEQVNLTHSLAVEKKSYREALANGSEFSFFFDITEGIIHEEFVTAHNINIIKKLGFSAPVSFDELLAKYVEVCGIEFSDEKTAENFTCKGLISQFERGVTNAVTEYYNPQSRFYIRTNCLMSLDDETGHIHGSVVASDITEIRMKENAQKEALKSAYELANMANSAKTDFLANMSHDIRTPINAIIGLTAIAGTHIDDKERLADCLSKITVSSKHLLGIINEVLDMSKIESGKMDLQEEEFNLPELIDNLLIMSKPEVAVKNHEFSVLIKNIEHENVIGDSQRIQQAFMNILSNAVKYTQDGGNIKLTISEKATNKAKVGCYEFIFEDNGIGMSEEFQKHVFEPFARARDDANVNKIQGTGLGMPITKNIIQMMNGNIKVESKLNKGTKITVTFFLKLKNDEEVTDYEKFIDLSVLVADDDKVSCVYTCDMLREIGMNGEWVLTGQEAVERVMERHKNNSDFSAVILDWRMPGMDGIETTREIRRQVGKHVPIIIISAYDWSDIELEARAAGANAFISKPLFKSRIVHLFNELVGGENQEQGGSELDMLANEDFSGKRALLVEDNELNAEIAGEILDMAGFEVEFAKDGKQAVDIMTAIDDDYFDVVFMDIQMPVMNGYEAVRAIRALSRDYTKSVPIIAMTANAFAEDVAMAKNAGMNEHIAKPLDFGQLLKALKKWL